MAHRPGAGRVARLAVSTTLLLSALPAVPASGDSQQTCRHPHGPRCAASQRRERAAVRAARWAALRAAPTLAAEGTTLSWSPVPGVQRYVLVRILAGKHVPHIVTGTSFTPRSVAGATAQYLVRTHVAHSQWSVPVTIAYPGTSRRHSHPGSSSEGTGGEAPGATQPGSGTGSTPGNGPGSETGSGSQPGGSGSEGGSEHPGTEGGHSTAAFETGVVPTTLAGSEPGTIRALGAHSVRMEFPVGAPASALATAVEAYARVGLRLLPLAGFYGTLPSPAEARNLATWAATYGPGGSFWAGKPFPEVPVTDIEFGNETSYTYQFSDNSQAAVAARAGVYATRLKEAQTAIAPAGSVGLLAQADDGGTGSPAWVNGMFAAVPDLASRVAGWTVHPYGPTWQRKIDALIGTTAAHNAPSSIPIYVTELGIAVDNGHCLSENYGWNPCMTNSEAATTLANVVGGMRNRYGNRLRALYLYQAQDQKPENATNDRENYFGLLQSNGASKGAFTSAVESVLSSGASAAVVRAPVRAIAARNPHRRHGYTARLARRRHNA